MLRSLDLETIGRVTLRRPARRALADPRRGAEGPARSRRGRPGLGPRGARGGLSPGAIAVLVAPEDAAGPAMREAMAAGCAVLAPRCPAVDEVARHGVEALVLPPFSRDALVRRGRRPGGRRRPARGPRHRGRGAGAADGTTSPPTWRRLSDRAVLGSARGGGRGPRARRSARAAGGRCRPPADRRRVPRARPGGGRRGLAGRDRARPGRCRRRPGRPRGGDRPGDPDDRRRADRALPRARRGAGLDPRRRPRRSTPRGAWSWRPTPTGRPAALRAGLRRLGGEVDCRQLVSGPAPGAGRGRTARIAQRMGVLGCAGSGAVRPEDVGSAVTELRPFHGPSDFLDALGEARLARPPRRRRARPRRPAARPARSGLVKRPRQE